MVKSKKGLEGKQVANEPRRMTEFLNVMMQASDSRRDDEALDRAQEKIFDAWEASSPAKRLKLAREALAISPLCADAYGILADAAKGAEVELALRRQAVEAAAEALGPSTFEDDAGIFWGLFETRPYMRARHLLAMALWDRGRREEAVAHYQAMLELNPNDNQGIRYLLMDALLELGRDDEAASLLKRYKDDGSAAWTWSKALLTFRSKGDVSAARAALSKGTANNGHVVDYLLGHKRLPQDPPAFIGMGDQNEAIAYVHGAAAAWRATPGALTWVETSLAKRQAATAPADAGGSDTARIDDAVLALLTLGLHDGERAWKSFDWDALDRLHGAGLIENPRNSLKSVVLTDEGLRRARESYDRLFGEVVGSASKAAAKQPTPTSRRKRPETS